MVPISALLGQLDVQGVPISSQFVRLVECPIDPLFLGEIQYADSSLVRRFLAVRPCLGATVRKIPPRRPQRTSAPVGPTAT